MLGIAFRLQHAVHAFDPQCSCDYEAEAGWHSNPISAGLGVSIASVLDTNKSREYLYGYYFASRIFYLNRLDYIQRLTTQKINQTWTRDMTGLAGNLSVPRR